jgi:predicted HicB family RNase H-like nuclease
MSIDTLSYKDYHAETRFDASADEFHARVTGIKDVIDFYGKTPADLKQEFKNSVDDYLDWCQTEAKKPDEQRPALG